MKFGGGAFNPWTAFFTGPNVKGFGPSGFRWRMFDRGDLKYVILRLLRDRPMHGYEVMRALEEESQGCYTASPGSVYPTLQLLEDQGLVVSEKADGRKTYSITDAGREFLVEHRDRVEDIFERVTDYTKFFSGSGMTDLTRSFMRLAQVSFEGAVRRPGDQEVLDRLKEILDQATQDIEAASRS